MPLNLTKQDFVYNAGGTLAPLYTVPVVVDRAPRTNDFALPGQIWIDSATQSIYMLASITANSANWTTSPGSGVGVFTSVTVNPGDVEIVAGDLVVDAGDVEISAGNLDVGGNLTVDGIATFNGDVDITSADLISLTSTLNAAPSILFEANGGSSEQIKLYSNQGTAVDSILLFSNVGGVTVRGDLASNNAINLTATNGGVHVTGAMQINLATSYNNASAIALTSSAGGMAFTASGTAGEDISLINSASINLTASEAVADAINISASNAAGGIILSAGTGGIAIGDSATCSPINVGNFVPTSSRTITVAGGTVTTAVTDLVALAAGGVSTSASAAKQVNIASGNVLLGSSVVNINSGTAASGTSTVNISTGTGGGTKAVNVGNADGLTNVTIDGLFTVNTNINKNVLINTGTSTGTVTIGNSAAGAAVFNSGSTMTFGANATTMTMGNTTGASTYNVNAGTGGFNVSSAGIATVAAATASVASPTATAVINANVGSATFTGFTTASASAQVFTITNSKVTTSSHIIVSAANEGSNDAQMTVTRVNRGAGTFDVTLLNNGAAALNGNVTITFWALS